MVTDLGFGISNIQYYYSPIAPQRRDNGGLRTVVRGFMLQIPTSPIVLPQQKRIRATILT